jgi:restriction system protein
MQLAADGREHSIAEAIEKLALEFRLTEDERRELLPSGRQPKLDNRVGWAKTYLQKAGLLEPAGRAKFRATTRGMTTMQQNPVVINDKFLMRFPEYVDFKRRSNKQEASALDPQLAALRATVGSGQDSVELLVPDQTPEEILDTSYHALRKNLAQELLEQVKRNTPRFFEMLVVDLLVAMGYGGSRQDAGQAIGMSGDEGIDGIIKEDRLGLDVVYIQAKRWEGTVGRPTVQAFAGSLEGQRARKGVLITTSQFSKEAQEYIRVIEKRIVLVDGEQLAQLMIDFGIGVTEVETYVVKKIDTDFFGEE